MQRMFKDQKARMSLFCTMLVLVLIGTIILLWIWAKTNRNKDEPPICSGNKMLIGHALLYAGDSVHLWENLKVVAKEAAERGGVVRTYIGPWVVYILTNPEDYAKVANSCLQKDAVYDFSKLWLGDGLVTSTASQWKVHRKLLNPAFSQQVLDSFMGVFNSQSRCLVENLMVEVGKGPFDQLAYTKSNAFETICLTALGVDFKEKTVANIEYVQALSRIFKLLIIRFQTFWLHNNFIFGLSNLKRKQEECVKILHNMSNSILKQRKEILEKENKTDTKYKTFMDLLIELSRDTNAFTDREIREHVDTIIVGGHDTSATVLAFCMMLVGSNPRVQDKIQEELKTVFGDEDRDVTKQDLSQLVYLEAAIKETMRIYPIVPVTGRHLHEDIKLSNCTLSKGNSAFMFIYGVNRHSMWGTDVEEFRPERWFDPSTTPDSSYASASFSMGRRNCIGKTYAIISLKITMAYICRNFVIHGDYKKLKLKLDVMLKPVSGHHVTIEKRS